MSEEKKNLTEEERKELKEGLKKQVDELSDEELEQVAGGGTVSWMIEALKNAKKASQVLIILEKGICPICNKQVNLVGTNEEKNHIANEHINSGCTKHVL